jgi:hypothetical protein
MTTLGTSLIQSFKSEFKEKKNHNFQTPVLCLVVKEFSKCLVSMSATYRIKEAQKTIDQFIFLTLALLIIRDIDIWYLFYSFGCTYGTKSSWASKERSTPEGYNREEHAWRFDEWKQYHRRCV